MRISPFQQSNSRTEIPQCKKIQEKRETELLCFEEFYSEIIYFLGTFLPKEGVLIERTLPLELLCFGALY